jgi:hypothetical protein
MLNDVRFAKKTANRDSRVCALLVAIVIIVSGLSGCAGLVSKANSDPATSVAPSITAQPTSQTVTTGQTATFGVAASGTAPMTYQWKKSGAAISGATSSSYTTPATTSSDNGAQFAVTVTNTAGSVTSNAAILTVSATAVAPSITTEPANETVTAGQTATFNVAATGTAPLSYQWKKSGTAISGATSSTYTTPATTSADSGAQFTVVVSNTAGSVTSSAATLTVNAAAVAPSITTQPVSESVTTGQTATFSVVAAGTAPLTYQWKKSGTAISGAVASSYTTPATTSSDNGSQFTVTVTNSAGNVTSNAATLTVTASAVAPTITTQPVSKTVTAGQTATFSVVATGTAPLTYQWKKNGTAISGATSSSYTTPATTTADSGSQFTVVVTNAAGSATSNAATLTVNAAPVAPSITTQPVSVTVTAGQTATFSVVATGTAPLTYQWKKSGTVISGATASSYTTPATTSSDNGSQFTVVVTNAAGSATSNAATLTVNVVPVAPSITTQPANKTVTVGQTATFSVVATGTAPLTYQWKKSGTAISGATASSYTTPATASSDNGAQFTVVVTNAIGSATSNAATLTVNPVTPPSVPTGLTAVATSSSQISLNWNASTGSVSGYNVYRGGTQVGTSTATSYADAGLTASTTYTYTVAAYDSVGDVSGQSASASATTLSANATCASGMPCALGWYQIPQTALSSLCPTYSDIQGNTGCAAVTEAWGSALVDTKRNQLILHGGGHVDYDGNEIYAIDFNNLTAAGNPSTVLVKDASHGSAVDAAISACSEAFPDGTPNSRHDYNGWIYLPVTDEYFLYGGGISSCGNFSDGNWVFSPVTGSWTQLTPGTHPETSQNGSIPANAYDSVTGCVYMQETIEGNFWQYCRGAKSANWTLLSGTVGSNEPCQSDAFSVVIDPTDRLYVGAGSGCLGTISLSSPYATVNDAGASGCSGSSIITAQSPGMAWDPVQQMVILWAGGNSVLEYSPKAHTCTTVTYSGGPGSPSAAGTFGRFAYMPGLGGFLYADTMSTNIYFLRLLTAAAAAQQDFANRCAAPGVIYCEAFDNPADFTHLTNQNQSGLYQGDDAGCAGTSNCYGTQDTTTARSGAGSLLFTIPGAAGSDPSGFWKQLFAPSLTDSPAQATVFGQNSNFYVSYAQRMDSPYITNPWPVTGGGTTNWKQQIISSDQSTCGNVELTTVNAYNRGYPEMYTECGEDGFQIQVGSNLYQETNQSLITAAGQVGMTCIYGTTQPESGCYDYVPNVWATYYYAVSIGTWGSPNSNIFAYVSTPSSPAWQQWIYEVNHTLNQDAGLPDYDTVTLIPYWTGRDPTVSAGPTSHTWYDELIVSTQPIAPPQTPPAKP